MKRLSRSNERFDTIELFSSMAREHGYRLDDPQSQEDFIRRVRESLESSRSNLAIIHGKRVEGLFSFVVGALGAASIIKQEDAGEIFFASEEVLLPDYRVILNDGRQFLIEVKNHHSRNPMRRVSVKKSYFTKLSRYAEVNNLPMKFALYFSVWNLWTLVSPEAFDEIDGKYEIDMFNALGKSEMATLGDRRIGTTPNLELVFESDKTDASTINEDGTAEFTIQKIRMLCGGNEITKSLEQKLCFYLIRFGEWVESEHSALVDDNKMVGIRFVFSPESPTERQNFQFIGTLSSMISNAYREMTVEENKVIALTSKAEPTALQLLIPENYKGVDLPL